MKRLVLMGILVLAIGGGAFFLANKDDGKTNTSSTTNDGTETQTAKENAVENGNIYSLTSAGSAKQCTFSYSGATGTGTGTMYSDGKGRGLMTMDIKTTQGNSAKSNTLLTTDKVYGWSETNGQSYGFAYDKRTFTSSTSSASSSQNSTADPNQKFDLQCKDWSVDESLLKVPEGVNFMSLPAMTQ